jgi:hypothetical protein
MEPVPVLPSHRALGGEVYAELRSVVHGERFVNRAPADDYGTLLDDGTDLCSVPTTVRLLRRCRRLCAGPVGRPRCGGAFGSRLQGPQRPRRIDG